MGIRQGVGRGWKRYDPPQISKKKSSLKGDGVEDGDWEKAIREALGRLEEYGRGGGLEGSDKRRRSLRQPPSIKGRISIEGQPIPRLTSLWHVSLLEMH